MLRLFAAIAVLLTMIPTSAFGQLASQEDRRAAIERYREGQQYLVSEQWAKAAEEFTAAIKLDSLLTLAHYGLGQAYMGMKDYSAAIRAFSGCKEAHHRLAQLQDSNRVAVERMQDEELRELRDSLRTLQSGTNKGANPLTLQGLQNRIRDLENARQRNMPVEQSTPAEVSLALGSAYFRRGDLADAEREYRAAIAVSPKMGEAHNNLAVVLFMTQRVDEAKGEAALAKKNGFKVNPQFEEDLKNAKQVKQEAQPQ
jgi:tetratricopeptide (TPR) repeat protein